MAKSFRTRQSLGWSRSPFYRTGRFTTVFTRETATGYYLHFIIALPSVTGFPRGLYISGSPQHFCIPIIFTARYCTPNMRWGVQIMKLLLCNFLQPPASSSLFEPNALFKTWSSNTLNLHVSLVWEIKFQKHTEQEVRHRPLCNSMFTFYINNSQWRRKICLYIDAHKRAEIGSYQIIARKMQRTPCA